MISQLTRGRRVQRHTATRVNDRIRRQTEENIEFFARHPQAINARLKELDREWDVERSLEANASTLMVIGVLLGAFVDRRILILPGLVAAFLLQHAIQGWCPPLPIMRRLGVRTEREVYREYYALKMLRGDFDSFDTDNESTPAERARAAIRAVYRF